ncbi:hypothetical protein DV738_g4839, partial [Chaetothyriales sp. CBS 135597]
MRASFPYNLTIGTDISNARRILNWSNPAPFEHNSHGLSLLKRVLHKNDFIQLQRRYPWWQRPSAQPEANVRRLSFFLAGRWAAKEAAKKAWRADLLGWRDLWVQAAAVGAPGTGTGSGPPEILDRRKYNQPAQSSPSTRLNAWGLYGPSDQVGFLNRQTPAIIAAAASSEIKTGIRNVYQKKPRIVHDETWTLNTQSSSQWDGLRHFGYQAAGRFYNNEGRREVAAECGDGGGRGGGFNSFESTAIKLEWLKKTLAHQGTQLRFGDILIVRSGFFAAYRALSPSQRAALQEMRSPRLGGVEQSDAVLQWIWEHFSAVAADHPSFERWPTPYDWSMHEVLLGGWGCNIGELFDLDELSSECERQGRWSFFVSSVPCHVPGGVASPPNAVAIF